MKGFICILSAFLFLSFSSSFCEDISQAYAEVAAEEIPAGQSEGDGIEIITDTGDGYLYIMDEPIPAGENIEATTDAAISAGESSLKDITSEAVSGGESNGGTSPEDVQAPAAPSVASIIVTLSPAVFDVGIIYYENTYTFTGAAELQVTSTKNNWSLTASGTNFNNGSNTIDISRIKLKASASSTYETLLNNPVTLLSKQKTGTTIVRIDYQITLLSTDPAGADYLSNVTFIAQ